MKKLLLALLFLPIFAFAQAGPKMEVEGGENLTAGNFQRGKEVNYEIKFKNSGDSELKIAGVQTTCGCSSALVSGDVLQPGEAGSIKFTFNGQGFGQVMKSVIVSTNETVQNYHTIHVNMNMVDPVSLTPQSIITEGKVGDELTQTASIMNSSDTDINITDITSNTPVIKITADKMVLKAGEGTTLNIAIKIYEESAINAAIIINTSAGEFQIPVLVDVKPN